MSPIAIESDVLPSPISLLRRDEIPHSDRAIRSQEVIRVARGVYADAAEWRALRPWERYRARVHATAMLHPDAVFILESAAALRGLPVFGEPRDIHLAGSQAATSRAVSGVRIHTAQRPPATDEIGGLLVAAPAEIAVGIARGRHRAIGLAVAGAVLRQHPEISSDELRGLNERQLSSRGRRHARWALHRATGVPESTLEQVSLAVIEWLGFPAPELQKWIPGAPGKEDYRLDFWWKHRRIGGEADGDSKLAGTDALAALRSRRDRDAELIERGVSATAHWGWHDAVNAAPLRAALLAAGLRPERPEETAELRSLTRLLSVRPH